MKERAHQYRLAAPFVAARLLAATAAFAAPIHVRYPEGPAHGYVVLSDTAGKPLAHGELIQWLEAQTVASRLVFRFEDGSLYDETVRFVQKGVFRVQSYHLVQKGPSFTQSSDIEFDRSGRYRARIRTAPDKEEETASGTINVPADVSNAMTSTLVKNLVRGASATTHILAFTPKPNVLEMHVVSEGSDPFWMGKTEASASRCLVEIRVTGVTGMVASVIGKQPPIIRVWIAEGKVPTFVRLEGPLYADGPPWRIELDAPRWKR